MQRNKGKTKGFPHPLFSANLECQNKTFSPLWYYPLRMEAAFSVTRVTEEGCVVLSAVEESAELCLTNFIRIQLATDQLLTHY